MKQSAHRDAVCAFFAQRWFLEAHLLTAVPEKQTTAVRATFERFAAHVAFELSSLFRIAAGTDWQFFVHDR